jgi:hypothetical protein
VTGLLQRTRLHVTILCQAWHAKNSRHMLLGKSISAESFIIGLSTLSWPDVVDYVGPSMLIVGSRGLSRLRG